MYEIIAYRKYICAGLMLRESEVYRKEPREVEQRHTPILRKHGIQWKTNVRVHACMEMWRCTARDQVWSPTRCWNSTHAKCSSPVLKK